MIIDQIDYLSRWLLINKINQDDYWSNRLLIKVIDQIYY